MCQKNSFASDDPVREQLMSLQIVKFSKRALASLYYVPVHGANTDERSRNVTRQPPLRAGALIVELISEVDYNFLTTAHFYLI